MNDHENECPNESPAEYLARLKATLPDAYRDREKLVFELQLLKKTRSALEKNIADAETRLGQIMEMEDTTLTALAACDGLLREVKEFIQRSETELNP